MIRNEIWKQIPGFENCEASSLGRIRIKNKIRKPWVRIRRGRMKYFGIKIKNKNLLVSRLIAMAFHGLPPKNKPECMHIDNNPSNNMPTNLRWGDRCENMAMDRGNNHAHIGEKNPRAKLSAKDVEEIRIAFENRKNFHWGQKHFCKKFGIREAQCQRIINRRNWK